MNNVFRLKLGEKIEMSYDLKGSSHNRKTSDKKLSRGASGKDNNFREDKNQIYLVNHVKKNLVA